MIRIEVTEAVSGPTSADCRAGSMRFRRSERPVGWSSAGSIPKTADGLSAARCADERYMGGEYGARRALCDEGAALLGVPALRHATMAHVAALSGEVRKRCEFIVGENERVLAMSDALAVGDRGAIRCLCAEYSAGAHTAGRSVTAKAWRFFESSLFGLSELTAACALILKAPNPLAVGRFGACRGLRSSVANT